ncbi:hypothetical protein PTT_12328, partial [Pyrenophora teres f. teres 0-1]
MATTLSPKSSDHHFSISNIISKFRSSKVSTRTKVPTEPQPERLQDTRAPLIPSPLPLILPEHQQTLSTLGWTTLTFPDSPLGTQSQSPETLPAPGPHPLQAAYRDLFIASQAFFAQPATQKAEWAHKLGTEEGWSHVPGEKEFITLRTLAYCPSVLRVPAKRYWDLIGTHCSSTLDTIDLQDKTSPTAQDHSQQPQHPAPLGIGPAAPHQQAAIRHVEEERHSEEARLHDAWSDAGTTLRDDPGSDDERTVVNNSIGQRSAGQDDQAVKLNGGTSGDSDDADMQDADEEDMDDDMMDKISSSPSIDDGGYPLPSYPAFWPARQESLTPHSSPLTVASSSSSSPFMNTPLHFPISFAHARRPLSVPACETSPLPKNRPTSIPVPSQVTPAKYIESTEHHRGEYTWPRITDGPDNAKTDITAGVSPRTAHMRVVERRIQAIREDSEASILSELDEEHLRSVLRPISRTLLEKSDDPFLEPLSSPSRRANETPSPKAACPEDDEDDWTTDTDADSWDEDLDQDNDDAPDDVSFSEHSRFIDSGWGGECLRETEDIDFEFVYALHTFVATVEGQANATKGDTMVLLDDSNSYWWLVRVVKDNSIGYLPAEHIETPTERLARLNKHRNIDLSATMLGDTAEKSKNPLKKAMRRRNAKTVQFAPPTYVEASDYDYSSDEGEGELFGGPEPRQQQAAAQNDEAAQEGDLQVQPLHVNGGKKDVNGQTDGDARSSSEDPSKRGDDQQSGSEDTADRPLDPKVSRNGTVRNTDSFFKDENTETRKITLTPNLLRDDSNPAPGGNRERGASLESLEKNGFADKVKDDKRKKEKKS